MLFVSAPTAHNIVLHVPAHSVLVANNGLAAVKFMRSVRSWASQVGCTPHWPRAMPAAARVQCTHHHFPVTSLINLLRACFSRMQVLGNARAVSLLAMATPNDMRVNAEHISLADQFVEVPGGANANNYANVTLIVQVAQRAGVDAVWPGW
jgi:acetyl-CoA carboxylase/biotin carboxylase 1